MKRLFLITAMMAGFAVNASAADATNTQQGFYVNDKLVQAVDKNGNLNLNMNNYTINPTDKVVINANNLTMNGGPDMSSYLNHSTGDCGGCIFTSGGPISTGKIIESGMIQPNVNTDYMKTNSVMGRTNGKVNIEGLSPKTFTQAQLSGMEPASGGSEGAHAMNLNVQPGFDSSKLTYDANGNVMLSGD